MNICEMIRQFNEIFCSTIRNWAITAHAFSHVNDSRDEKDIVGTKGTKQGHSGQKETIGTFEVSLFFFSGGSLTRGITRGASARRGRFLFMKARFCAGLLTFNDMNDRQRIFSLAMSLFIYPGDLHVS